MQFQFDHNNLNVLDLERSVEFYKKALGLQELKRTEAGDHSFTRRWAASALKTRPWACTLSTTRTATGRKSSPPSKRVFPKQKTGVPQISWLRHSCFIFHGLPHMPGGVPSPGTGLFFRGGTGLPGTFHRLSLFLWDLLLRGHFLGNR